MEKMDELGPEVMPWMTALLRAIGEVYDGGEIQELRVSFVFDHAKKNMDMTIHQATWPGMIQ